MNATIAPACCPKCGESTTGQPTCRRLHTRCYDQAARKGQLDRYPRVTKPGPIVIVEYAHLREQGYTLPAAARELKMTEGALSRALYRARRRARLLTEAVGA